MKNSISIYTNINKLIMQLNQETWGGWMALCIKVSGFIGAVLLPFVVACIVVAQFIK